MLITLPTNGHLSRMYHELSKVGANSTGAEEDWPYKTNNLEELITLASDMSRFDPRLFGIMVEYFSTHWHNLNPLNIRKLYSQMKTPQTVPLICEFAKELTKDSEAMFFFAYLQQGIDPVTPQFYFHNLYSPAGRLAIRAVEEGIKEYKKWGFLASERPVIHSMDRQSVGSLDPISRINILQRLLNEKKEISISEYLEAVNYSISRQQALVDIRYSGLAVSVGGGRGAMWRMVA